MQNWVANAILKSRTVESAQIAAITMPYQFKVQEIDLYLYLLHGTLTIFITLM